MREVRGQESGLFWRRRTCWVPTWRFLVLAAILVSGAAWALALGVHPYLAPTHPIASEVLVVEGWCDDEFLKAAVAEFSRGKYDRILVTGGPLEQGSTLSEYRTYAELGAASLSRIAPPGTPITAVPASKVDRDRTYNSGLALRKWFREQGTPPAAINLLSVGVHARRSRLLFEKAMAGDTSVGIIAATDPSYDARRWWTTSNGVRNVIDEFIAFFYAALLFHPDPQGLQGTAANTPKP